MRTLSRVGLLSLALGASTATAALAATAAEREPQAIEPEGDTGTNMTGQPNTTPLPGSDVPTPFDQGKNRTPEQRKAGRLFDNVPVDPGPAAPSPQAAPGAGEGEDRTIHNARRRPSTPKSRSRRGDRGRR